MWEEICFKIFVPKKEKARFPNWFCVLMTRVVEEESCRHQDYSLFNLTTLLKYIGTQIHKKNP